MSTVEKSIRLYAWKPNYRTFRIVEGEANSRVLNIQLFAATTPVNLKNCLVLFFAVKPDSTNSYIDCEIVDAETGLVTVTLTDQIAAVDGVVDCWIQVIGNSGTDLRFAGMNIEVSDCNLSKRVESADEYPGLVEAMSRANEAANLVTEFADSETARSVFEQFSSSKKYVVGNKVVYKGSSYVCIKDTTAGILPTNTKYWLLFAERGASGVYIGSGDMPDHCNVQIDPDGDAVTIPEVFQETGDSEEDTMSQKAISRYVKELKESVVHGTYAGTGKSGATYKCRLEFPAQPEYVFIEGYDTEDYAYSCIGLSNGMTQTVVRRQKQSSTAQNLHINNVTWSGNSVEWWYNVSNDDNAGSFQCNDFDTTYHYVALLRR